FRTGGLTIGRRLLVRGLFLLGFISLLGVLLSYTNIGQTSFSRLMDDGELSGGASSRTVIFQLALEVIAEHPIIGTGLGGFRDAWQNVDLHYFGDTIFFQENSDFQRGTFYTQNQLL